MRAVKRPISVGIDPVKELCDKSIVLKLTSSPMCEDMDPDNDRLGKLIPATIALSSQVIPTVDIEIDFIQ